MKTAKELTEKRFNLRDILVSHDIEKFREFIQNSTSDEMDSEKQADILSYDDEKLSQFMHALKSTQLYLSDSFQQSRNVLRAQEALMNHKWFTPDLIAYLANNNDALPLCSGCVYYREGDSEDPVSCMHKGAMPADVACAGWVEAKT